MSSSTSHENMATSGAPTFSSSEDENQAPKPSYEYYRDINDYRKNATRERLRNLQHALSLDPDYLSTKPDAEQQFWRLAARFEDLKVIECSLEL